MPPYRKFPPPHGRCAAPAAAPAATYPPARYSAARYSAARYSAPHIRQPHNLRPIFGKGLTRRTVERQRPIFRTELPRQRPSPSCAQGHAGFTRPRHSTISCHQPTGSNRAPFIGTASIRTRRRKNRPFFLAIKAKNRYLCSDATGRLAAFRTHFGHRITPIPYL